jgi:hypothetical protein
VVQCASALVNKHDWCGYLQDDGATAAAHWCILVMRHNMVWHYSWMMLGFDSAVEMQFVTSAEVAPLDSPHLVLVGGMVQSMLSIPSRNMCSALLQNAVFLNSMHIEPFVGIVTTAAHAMRLANDGNS